jgi:RHH-type proline utilization regulon transcriptional repressor/proline dehydrogenase/delta 1-pyrroline-5-carboxylate dehydrogenase
MIVARSVDSTKDAGNQFSVLYFFRIALQRYRQDVIRHKTYRNLMNTHHQSLSVSSSQSPQSASPDVVGQSDFCDRVTGVAEQLLVSALAQQRPGERAEAAKLGAMMNDPAGKALTFAMVDEVFRSHDPTVAAKRFRELIKRFGVPRYMPLLDRLLMHAGVLASRVVPRLVIPGIARRMRADSSRVILAGEKEPLHQYLTKRTGEGFRINLNHLGEAVLGEAEAANRLAAVLQHLSDPAISYISVKISSIYSQVSLIAWDQTLAEIKNRLRTLYRAAATGGKFVNLDMEEYRDLEMTVEAFCGVLDEPEFHGMSAGIVLQAYLPDSSDVQRELTRWARDRVSRGAAPIKIRLVKGANLAMEAVEAELHGWKSAPYPTKAETDANFRRMLEFGCQRENAVAVRLGVASHNLFDVALAITLRRDNDVSQFVEIEMLEGMANHQARAVRDAACGLLLYAPAVQQEDFLSAMAYLVRRLDENTAPENFLREMFAMRPGSQQWTHQQQRFESGWKNRLTASSASRRSAPADQPSTESCFVNSADSDWTLRTIRVAMDDGIAKWQPDNLPALPHLDPMLSAAKTTQSAWEALGITNRSAIMNQAADIMTGQRYTTIACLRADGKKAIADSDGEVSEAIDFARYYARTADVPTGALASAVGIVAVVSPWNFPYAIPAGGVIAALMAGNSVIFKPAPATVQTAWLLVQQLWAAGVPRDVLHFYPCDNNQGEKLLTDPRISTVVLTGSYATARKFQSWRPSLPLLAETSGKNALIITAQADRELAIKDLVRSAFGHAGQKCSAASLAIIEAEVYDDPIFCRQLRDAAASLHVGAATDRRSVVTPLVIEPKEDLLRALTTLEPGEQWLLQPQKLSSDNRQWTPGIRMGVQPGSWFHQTECFGPVLGMMRATSLDDAVRWQNEVEYGLTAGIHSLDPAEVDWWQQRVQAGNLYVNRPITGAIVQRQPFGGWKKSCIGPGAKAGGPNYVKSFYRLRDAESQQVDYRQAWLEHFSLEHDPAGLRCESNKFRYRPCRGVILRVDEADTESIARAKLAAEVTNTKLTISFIGQESEADLIARLPSLALDAEFLRTIAVPGDALLSSVYALGLNWIQSPLQASGRLELCHWTREQSISETRHRYGQLSEPAYQRRG